jgi:hypothetical protein
MGFIHGARYGLLTIFVLGAIGSLAPIVSANPIATVDMYIVPVPILLVLLNYPINGLMLFVMYRLVPGEPEFHRSRSPRAYVADFGGAVLLFTLFGALIDFLTWMGVYEGYNELELAYALGGLAAIGGTCYLVCTRYLSMDKKLALATSFVTVLVNLLSWGFLYNADFAALAYICIPIVTAGWVLFEILLVLTSVTLRAEYPARILGPMPNAQRGGKALPPVSPHPQASMGARRLRMELWGANAILTAVLLVTSFAMLSIGYWD